MPYRNILKEGLQTESKRSPDTNLYSQTNKQTKKRKQNTPVKVILCETVQMNIFLIFVTCDFKSNFIKHYAYNVVLDLSHVET